MTKYYLLFILLNLIDLIGSYFILDPYLEWNPVVTYLWKNHGYNSVILLKALFTAFPLWVIYYYATNEPFKAKIVMIVANLILCIPIAMLVYLWSLS